MKRCVIHIGMHKTGSTSIQKSFCNQLNNSAWKYADMGHSNHSYLLAKILDNDLPGGDAAIGLGITSRDEIIERLLKDLDQEGENYLLSGEWMSSRVEVARLMALRDLLLRHVNSITVVGYVRPPKSYMESSFQERLKMATLKLDFEDLRPKYRPRLEHFDTVFGKENVMFWKFDPATFKNHCVVQDFCERLDIEFPEKKIKRRNESLSREATAFLYTYRTYAGRQDTGRIFSENDNVILVNHLAQLKGGKLRFASDMVRPVLDANRADIEWMEKRIGTSLEEPDADSEDVVRSEADLLRYKPEDLMWLAKQLGSGYVDNCHPQMSPEEVADWMQALHVKLLDDHAKAIANVEAANVKTNPGNETLGLKELVRRAKKTTPELETLSDTQAIALLSSAFKQINQKTEQINDGKLRIPGLGVFQVNPINHEKDGQKITLRRIIFRALGI